MENNFKSGYASAQQASDAFNKLGKAFNHIPEEEMIALERAANSFSLKHPIKAIEYIKKCFSSK